MASDGHHAAPVAITGIGLAASLGLDAPSVWQAIVQGRVGLGPIPAVESVLPPGSTGGQAPDLPPQYHAALPREARYLRWSIEQALQDARISPAHPSTPGRRAVALGTTLHGLRAGGRFLRNRDHRILGDFLAGATMQSAIRGLGLEGPAVTTCSACSSSLGAVALGITLLETNQADVVVVGGYDAIGEYVWAGFNSLRLVSPGVVRPFARGREGMKVGEGFGTLVLERAADAARRGATVHALLEGWGESADAHHLTQPHPEGAGAAAAMRDALDRAAADPASLGFVAAHATATPDNDASEYRALRTTLGPCLGQTPVIGFKSYLGHTLGGAGAVELILSVCALKAGRAPACANVSQDQVEFEGLNIPPARGVDLSSPRAMNISLGFGGANTCVVVSRAAPSTLPPRPLREAWITGIGAILPGITGAQALADRVNAHDLGSLSDAEIDDAQLAPLLNVRRMRRLGPNVKLMLAAAANAVADAGLQAGSSELRQAAAILASTHGSSSLCSEYYTQLVQEGVLSANPVLFAEGVPNAAAAHLSITFGLRGGCQTLIGTRTSGLDALGLAMLRVQSGASDLVVAGASEETFATVLDAYREFGLHRKCPDDPGFVAVPGGAALIVESADSAARRGAKPLAILTRYAAATSSPLGPAAAMTRTLKDVGPVDNIIASSNGTWIDRAERLALRRAAPRSAVHAINHRIGEVFSAGPLLAIAWAIAGTTLPRFAAIASGFEGGTSAVMIERVPERPGATPRA